MYTFYDFNCNFSYCRQTIEQKNSSSSIQVDNSKDSAANDKKKPHIKKPLNAFMLYMKEMRAKVVAECTLKESAAINQILGRKVCNVLSTLITQKTQPPLKKLLFKNQPYFFKEK